MDASEVEGRVICIIPFSLFIKVKVASNDNFSAQEKLSEIGNYFQKYEKYKHVQFSSMCAAYKLSIQLRQLDIL